MNKNSPLYDDEVDLIELLKTIWNEKIKILLITAIVVIIVSGLSYKVPKQDIFNNSLTIKPSQDSEFYKFSNVNKLLNISSNMMFEKFIFELSDREEVISVLKDYEPTRKLFFKSPTIKQKKLFYDYAKKNLVIKEVIKFDKKGGKINSKKIYTINFKWHDKYESLDILNQTINLTLINIQKKVFKNLEEIHEKTKTNILRKDLKRIEYLEEQAKIATELNIEVETDSLTLDEGVFLNLIRDDLPYYLRGYKAIRKEMELIRNRDYKQFTYLDQEIAVLKKMDINWIDYNILNLESKLINNNKKKLKLIIMFSIVMGLIIGAFYVLIINAFKNHKKLRKKY